VATISPATKATKALEAWGEVALPALTKSFASNRLAGS